MVLEVIYMIGIYKITNTINNKCYIGQSIDLTKRIAYHKRALKGKYHENNHLQKAVKKYGINNFTYEILCECRVDELDELERMYIVQYDSIENGYNLETGGSSNKGMNEETKKKISETKKQNMTEEQREYYANFLRALPPLSPEGRKKLSQSLMGHKTSEETRKKISESQKGKIISEEAKQKMSKARTGKKWPQERCDKLSKSKTGIKKTKEHRKNLSLAKIGKPNSCSQPINQYDLQGNFIKEWDFLKQIENETGITSNQISKCLQGHNRIAKGYIWKFKNDNTPIIPYKNKSHSPIYQCDENYNIIRRFESIREAEKATGITNISRKIIDNVKSGEYRWKYAEDNYDKSRQISRNS